jgi:hypothetical protein
VVHEGRTPQQVVESLLSRARKAESD